MKLKIFIICSLLICLGCKKGPIEPPPEYPRDWISAVDISRFPEIRQYGHVFYDSTGTAHPFISILRESGVNTVRLRLWVNPIDTISGLQQVSDFAEELRAFGFHIWLCLHYSDTWADPGRQITPQQWQGLSFAELRDSVYDYTRRVVLKIQPDYIQIGNEINPGFLHPQGNITTHQQQFNALLETGIKAVREHSSLSRIIIHIAGIKDALWFYDQIDSLDYDIIGLSYYPLWHGKSLDSLSTILRQLSGNYQKQILIAETAYPFTLNWNDQTNNIVGLNSQLIPGIPATPAGQAEYIAQLKHVIQEVDGGVGICYWGAELIAWKGNQATDGSSWENQALFSFDNKALPALYLLSE